MKLKTNKASGAYTGMLDAMDEVNNIDDKIARNRKEYTNLVTKKEEAINSIRVFAANFFTAELIHELYERSKNYKLEEFNEEEYIQSFSNSKTIQEGQIEFLIQRLADIEKYENKLDCSDAPHVNQKSMDENATRRWEALYNFLQSILGGGDDND